MANENGVFVFPEVAKQAATNGLDPNLLLALQNNGGFGGNGNWIWILFLWLIWGGNWGNNNGLGGNGTGFLANQMSNDAGRDLLLQAINGRADAASQLAQITNASVSAVQAALTTIQSSIQNVGQQVGMSGLQVQNAIQSGNASISQQLCQCCCENRLAIANQTNAIQANLASNQAALQLQTSQQAAANQLAVAQQTNTLASQNTANTQKIVDGIAQQNVLITKEFCDLKDRELQHKIDTLTADNALLRSNLSNNLQTQQFAAMLSPIQAQLSAIQSKQPQVITLPFNQYAVVPNWAAAVGADFLGSYWANKVTPTTSTTSTTTTA